MWWWSSSLVPILHYCHLSSHKIFSIRTSELIKNLFIESNKGKLCICRRRKCSNLIINYLQALISCLYGNSSFYSRAVFCAMHIFRCTYNALLQNTAQSETGTFLSDCCTLVYNTKKKSRVAAGACCAEFHLISTVLCKQLGECGNWR